MSHWTVGEGRSLPWTRAMERLAAEDDAANERLDRQLAGEYRERPQKLLCDLGHPIDGERHRSNGRSYRYCKTCAAERMRLTRKARSS